MSDLSPRQVAEALGVSRSLVYALIDRGELPHAYSLSNRIRIPRSDLDELKERRRVRPRQPLMYEPETRARPRSGSFATELRLIRDGAA